MGGCSGTGSIDQIRSDFVALRYAKTAMEALREPVDVRRAVHNANRAIKLAPNNDTVLDRAGHIYLQAHEYEQALVTLQKARQRTGRGYFYELGTCLVNTGQQEKGTAYLAPHLQIRKWRYEVDTSSRSAYATQLNNVGYVYAEADLRLNEALKLTRSAVALSPLNPAFIDSLGWIYYKLGDLTNARFYLERAVRQSLWQPNAELNYHLAMAYIGLGRRAEAARELKRALQIRPGYPAAQRELRSLHWELAPPWYAQTVDQAL